METIGAPHSSSAFKHCSTVSFSLMVSTYSRIRPQPVQVRLQACRGSSIITSGNFSRPRRRLPAMYVDMRAVRLIGNLTILSPIQPHAVAGACNEPTPTTENNDDISGTSNRTPLENLCP